jgi:hypothetical protein
MVMTPLYGVAMLLGAGLAQASQWPEGLSFVGLTAGEWRLYVVPEADSAPQAVLTATEPRTPVYEPRSGRIAYISADGSLHEQTVGGGESRALLEVSDKQAFTQPAYGPAGDRLYVVALKEGASVDTDILMLDEARASAESVVIQRSAQFEPWAAPGNVLYYANVLCTVGCGKIIQEIWRIDLVSEDANQLTLLNGIARQPTLSPDGEWLYFSSNKAGRFHIWRLRLRDQHYEQLTSGNVTDVSPALDAAGNLYFVRRSPAQIDLMRLTPEGEPEALALPSGITDIRDLEMGWP